MGMWECEVVPVGMVFWFERPPLGGARRRGVEKQKPTEAFMSVYFSGFLF